MVQALPLCELADYAAMVDFSRTERAALADLCDELGPGAPTLCAGWTTHDLAAHLWIRETDPLAAPGLVAKPLAGLTERRMAEAKSRWSYPELVERVRRGPAPLSVFAFPGIDEEANTVEYFIHHEDVRRADGREPRELAPDVEDWIWRRLKLLGRALFRKADVGIVLERGSADPEAPREPEPESNRVNSGSETVTIVGAPSELMLYAYGRGSHAAVRLIGEPEALEALERSDFGM